jgi:hypothetical protein
MLKRTIALASVLLLGLNSVKADEGMWLLHLIKDLNYADMKAKGLKLTPEQIYSVNGSSLKDAILTMNGGMCTGEMISKEGLFLTNHHCGYDAIQGFSSPEHNYLKDGYWAMKRSDEMHVAGMTVTFLVRVEDVSERVNKELNDNMSPSERMQKIEKLRAEIVAEAIKGTHYEAYVREMYEGSEFYLFVNETFRDVRFVGAPPESVGKYGGDTDNWMWPRHTGDFSMFRVYAGADNKPADYSPDNKPFKPRHHLPVALDGVEEGDFAMIMGYPGSTDRYLTSYGVKHAVEADQPARVKIRRMKLDMMKLDMDKDVAVRIKYASKYAQVANYWKYFLGQSEQLKKNKVYDKKKAEEDAFAAWVNQSDDRKKRYGTVLKDIADAYDVIGKYWYGSTYLQECVFGPELHAFFWKHLGMRSELKTALESGDEAKIKAARESMIKAAEEFYKDYNPATDQKIYAAMLKMYHEDVPKDLQPDALKALATKYKGDFSKYAAAYFKKSPFRSLDALKAFINTATAEKIEAEPAYKLFMDFINAYISKFLSSSGQAEMKLDNAKRLLIEGYRKMNPDKKYYPDANSTQRLTYGTVGGYESNQDAVIYKYYTTIDGIIQKMDNTNPEFEVPARLVELYNKKEYGRYAQDGQLRVCFLTNNDITGGNSGSPVIDGEGNLIGCAFDGNWEAMSGDIFFEKQLQKTICVDIRYVLWFIDVYAGAKHLVDEMTIAPKKDRAMMKTEKVMMDTPRSESPAPAPNQNTTRSDK